MILEIGTVGKPRRWPPPLGIAKYNRGELGVARGARMRAIAGGDLLSIFGIANDAGTICKSHSVAITGGTSG